MRVSDLFENDSNDILYHGDNIGTTKLQAQWMLHGESNNQEGVGIYFSPDIEIAYSYGDKVSSISKTGLKIVNSRRPVDKVINDRTAIKLLQYLNIHDSDFWYMLTDYGIEVSSQNQVQTSHLTQLHNMMKQEEIRNWQIELTQATDVITVVNGWNQIIKIDALFETDTQFYAVINTNIVATPVNFGQVDEQQLMQIDEVGVMSSWIADLSYENDSVIMTLNNGRTYRILGIPKGTFRQWIRASSKGKFWHSNLRGHYRVSEI